MSVGLGIELPFEQGFNEWVDLGINVVSGFDYPAFMLAAGTADCLIPNQQSQKFNDLLTSVGATSTVTLLDGASHGDTMFNEQLTTPTLEFLTTALGS